MFQADQFHKPTRTVNRVFLHCTASSDPALSGDKLVAEVTEWHKKRKFRTVGYHYLIDFAGTILPGRKLEDIPAAQEGHNTGTIAICCHGLKKSDFTEPQMNALRSLCVVINAAYGGSVTFHGHREVANKECPVFDYKQVLGLDDNGLMSASAVGV
ncbi:MAG: N-acetylmuramoyl-L-alanine amidase [Alphaproteobacteria bacterium]